MKTPILAIFISLTVVCAWPQSIFPPTSNGSSGSVATDDDRFAATSVIEQVAWTGNSTLTLAALGQAIVNTSGTAVTWLSGSKFVGLTSSSISIGPASYTVSSVTDSTHLVLSASAGTQSSVAMLMPGTITKIQLAITATSGSSLLDSKLNVYCNGVPSPGEQADLGTFFFIHGGVASTPWTSVRAGVNTYVNADHWGGYRETQIPYTSGCTLDIANATATSGTVYAQIFYRVGSPLANSTGILRKVWHAKWIGATSVGQFAGIDLLPSLSGTGEIESVYLLILSNSSFTYLEGNVDWLVDGAQGPSCGGTEDCFGGQYYWKNGAGTYRGDEWGAWMGTQIPNVSSAAFSTAAYRFHYPFSRLPFQSSAKLTWHNGQSGQGTPPGSVTILSLVTYWTTQ